MVYPRWWLQRFAEDAPSLSILDIINTGTLDCRVAGLLWVLMEHRASTLVAAGPSFAGKSTLFHAIMDFLPPEIEQIELQGHYEDFKFLDTSIPKKSYLLTEEISNHQYEYLWGVKAVRAFNLLDKGYALGGTIHARNAEEALTILHRYLSLPLPLLSKVDVVVNLHARAGQNYDDEPIRRLSSVNLILPHPQGLAILVLAARRQNEQGFEYQQADALEKGLADKFSTRIGRINQEIDAREYYLKHLLKKGQTTREEVRKGVADYYHSKGG